MSREDKEFVTVAIDRLTDIADLQTRNLGHNLEVVVSRIDAVWANMHDHTKHTAILQDKRKGIYLQYFEDISGDVIK